MATAAAAAAAAATSSMPTWPVHTFVTEPEIQFAKVSYNKTADTSPGYMFLTPGQANTGVIMSDEGDLVWSAPYSEFEAFSFIGLTPQTLHDEPVLVYNDIVSGSITEVVAYGTVVILDQSYEVKHNVTLSDPDLVTQYPGEYASVANDHESYITDDNTLLVIAYNATPWDLTPIGGPKNGWLRDCLLYELDIDTNEILYRWRASDELPPTEMSYADLVGPVGVYGNGTTKAQSWDAYHINALQDYKGGFLVSIRNTYMAAWVDKKTHKIGWKVEGKTGGDFKLLDDDAHFSWQHDVRIKPGVSDDKPQLHMFNNQNERPDKKVAPSVGLILELDLTQKTVRTLESFKNSSRSVYTWNSGSFQMQPDHHAVLGYGSESVVQEYDAAGKMIYEMVYGFPYLGYSYRVLKSAWRGWPKSKPKAKLCKQKDGSLRAFMSWNGATEIKHWNVYGGSGKNDTKALSKMATIQRTGFETNVTISNGTQAVQVEAVCGCKAKFLSEVVAISNC